MADATPRKHQLNEALEKNKWKKGQSGNPKGRPPGSGLSLTTEMKRKLAEVPRGARASNLEQLIEKIFNLALKDGDQQIIKQIWAYIDGMPKQHTDITSGDKPIPLFGQYVSNNNSNGQTS